jgi:hypothetical protein
MITLPKFSEAGVPYGPAIEEGVATVMASFSS